MYHVYPVFLKIKYMPLTSSGTTVSTGTISASTISISTITPIITVSTIAIASITISSFGDGQATLGKLPHKRNDNGNSLALSYVLSLKQCNTWCRLALNLQDNNTNNVKSTTDCSENHHPTYHA